MKESNENEPVKRCRAVTKKGTAMHIWEGQRTVYKKTGSKLNLPLTCVGVVKSLRIFPGAEMMKGSRTACDQQNGCSR